MAGHCCAQQHVCDFVSTVTALPPISRAPCSTSQPGMTLSFVPA